MGIINYQERLYFMRILKQFALIFLLFWVSHGISTLLPFTMPASVIGLLLMFLLLLSGILKTESIREAAEFLQGNMTLFLLPVVTSSMNYVDIIMENALGFFVVCIVTTILTYAAVVWSVHLTVKLMKKGEDEE